MKNEQNRCIAGLYCRLSREDKRGGESMSIDTQRKILGDYCLVNSIEIHDYYVDDGWSGTSYNRPDFKRMMRDMENGLINTIVVKDLSRLGRDHLENGKYIEYVFPEKGIRFISVNDNIDRSPYLSAPDMMMQFKNLFAEFYPADISDKTRKALRAKAEHGEYLAAFAPYGYKKSAQDKHKLEPDADTMQTVVRIFEMAAYKGYGYQKIAKELRIRKILTPTAYRCKLNGQLCEKDPYDWTIASVQRILENPCYLGHTVNGKSHKLSYKSDVVIDNPKEEWIVVENTHTPIISETLWNAAQARITSRKRTSKTGQENMFAGLLKCDTCGRALTIKNTKGKPNFFSCTTHAKKGKEYCTFHYLRYDLLYQVVLTDIQTHLHYMRRNPEAFTQTVMNRLGAADKQKKAEISRSISTTEANLRKLDARFDKMYDDRVKGLISDEMLRETSRRIETEKEQLREQLADLRKQLGQQNEAEQNVMRFQNLIKEYTEVKELNSELLNRLIDKIVVSERVREETGFSQQITIYYRFIGNLTEEGSTK